MSITVNFHRANGQPPYEVSAEQYSTFVALTLSCGNDVVAIYLPDVEAAREFADNVFGAVFALENPS